jgi:hypothetical protein
MVRSALVAAAVLCLLVAGCVRHVPGPYTPEVAGVVVSSQWIEASSVGRFVLHDGSVIEADTSDRTRTKIILQAGPPEGDLLLSGTTPQGQWLAIIPPASLTRSDLPPDCFPVTGYATDDSEWVQTDIGHRLRKAATFDPGLLPDVPGGYVPTARPGLRYEATGQVFCVNQDGLVTRVVVGWWKPSQADPTFNPSYPPKPSPP